MSLGFESTRPFPDPTFTYAAPPFAPQAQLPPTSASYQNAGQMTHMAYASNPSRPSYDDQSGPYLNVGSTPTPQVMSYSPNRGTKGTKVHVTISSLYELMTTSLPAFFLMFGSRKCEATLMKLNQQGGVCQYAVTTDAPMFTTTGWSSSQVPVFMLMESGDGELMGKIDIGAFTYLDSGMPISNGPTLDVPRKRKVSMGSAELIKSPVKRVLSNPVRPKEEYTSYGYTSAESAPYSPYLQPGGSYGMMGQYGHSRSSSGYQPQASPRNVSYQYSSSTTASPPTVKAQSPQVSNWSPAYSNMNLQANRSPGLTPSHRPALSGLPSPSTANPPLIRTSTLQQSPSPGMAPGGVSGQFNPYGMYSHKAVLKIQGDLDGMAEGWSMDEWDAKRRIVLFKRSQSGSTITTTFSPVALDERPPNSVCISCIWWEEKNECFVTSVDTIYLLEQLVAARFTVEEKNRIRRNLEGFRPLTVSKAKPDSEEFFKVIMAFPNPKPRNIEKDVKVFPWKILSMALKKIIGKYVSCSDPCTSLTRLTCKQSASPSSVLPPALLTPVSSTGYAESSGSLPHANADHGAMPSPRSVSGSTTSTYNGFPPKPLSPHLKPELATQSGGPQPSLAPDLRVSVPSYTSSPHMSDPSGHWPAQPQSQGHQMAAQPAQGYLGSTQRNSWPEAMSNCSYLEPATNAGTAPVHYYRSDPHGGPQGSLRGQQMGRP
jgi:hypothetical protein